jgi:hypothetical protein
MNNVTIIGLALLLVYSITRILDFFGIGIDVYGSYLVFYLFLLLTYFVLPREYYKLKLFS